MSLPPNCKPPFLLPISPPLARSTSPSPTPLPAVVPPLPLTFTVNNPVPAVSQVSPASAVAGGQPFTLTLTGTGFVPTSQITWNGTALPTSFGSSLSISAPIPASYIATSGDASIAVVTPAPGGGNWTTEFYITPIPTLLSTYGLNGNDVEWDSVGQRLYVSAIGAPPNSVNSITAVDPVSGQIANSQPTTVQAGILSITDDGQFLYAALNGSSNLARYKLPSLALDTQIPLGSDPMNGAYSAGDVKAQPGQPHTIAVTELPVNNPNEGVLAIYDDAVQRPNSVGADQTYGFQFLTWKPDGTEIFSEDGGSSELSMFTIPVTQSGLGTVTTYNKSMRMWGPHLHYDSPSGHLFTDPGEIVDPATGRPVANYADRHRTLEYSYTLSVVDDNQSVVFILSSGPKRL